MSEILDLDLPVERPLVHISDTVRERIAVKDFVKNIDLQKPVIGLNVGVGTKWPSKGWPIKRWKESIKKLVNNKFNLLLLNGPEEVGIIELLKKNINTFFDTGCDNSELEFEAIVDLCKLVIAADTLALYNTTAP